MEPHGLLSLAAAPVGGGRAWPGFEIDHSEPQARVWRSRGRAAAHGRIKQPGPAAGSDGARNTRGTRQRLLLGDLARNNLAARLAQGQAAVPEGGGRARAGLEIDHSEPQARVWRSRGRAAAHRHTQRPGLTKYTRRPEHQRDHKQHEKTGAATPPPQAGKTKTADPEGSAVSSCARGELNPHSITGTRT